MVTIRRSEYEWMKSRISELDALVKLLMEEIALLKNGRNSGTSSTPPSHDLGRSNSISLREKSGKQSGGQSGHKGHFHALSDTPDQVFDSLPGVCEQCGEDLRHIESETYTRRQVVDIPPVQPHYTEHRSHVKTCPLCHFVNRGSFPEEVKSPLQYGSSVESMAGYLSVYQDIPYRRMKELFRDCFGLRISEGTIDNLLDRLAMKAGSVYSEIRERVHQSPVVGSDETGNHVNGSKRWFHVWQTPFLTYIVSAVSRGFKVISEHFPDGFLHSFYVSDCWAAQLKTPARGHQLCMAHLLRELSNFIKSLGSEWSSRMKDLFVRAIDLKAKLTGEDYINIPAEVVCMNKQLDELLQTDCSKFHAKEQAFIKRLIKNREGIFTFLTHPDVPPDNNASERAIRNVKVKTKVSGQFRNDDGKGADRYARIRSVVDTSIKNGQGVYTALICLANCKKHFEKT